MPLSRKLLAEKSVTTTISLEESGELVPLSELTTESHYGKALSEVVTTQVYFTKGILIVIERNGVLLSEQFYPEVKKDGKERTGNIDG
jgi:hypothetical protein